MKQLTVKLIPERLTQARLASVLNMTELAEKTGLSRQAISQFERGSSQPTAETLRKISNELDINISFLTTELSEIEKKIEGTPNFRSMATSAAKVRGQADTYLHWLAFITDKISQFISISPCNLPEFNISDFNGLSNYDIELFAEQTRRHFGIGDGPISNLSLLLENHGVIVGHSKFHKKVDGISAWFNDRPFVLININSTAVRARYDLAHELGHLVLHRRLISKMDLEDKESFKKIEKQANYFASCFLMPEQTFSAEVYGTDWDSLIEIKRRWMVSIAAIVMRLGSIDLISESKKVRLFQLINVKKARRFEPLDKELEMEKPMVFTRILELLNNEGILKHGEFSQLTGMKNTFLITTTRVPDEYLSTEAKLTNNVIQLRR